MGERNNRDLGMHAASGHSYCLLSRVLLFGLTAVMSSVNLSKPFKSIHLSSL